MTRRALAAAAAALAVAALPLASSLAVVNTAMTTTGAGGESRQPSSPASSPGSEQPQGPVGRETMSRRHAVGGLVAAMLPLAGTWRGVQGSSRQEPPNPATFKSCHHHQSGHHHHLRSAPRPSSERCDRRLRRPGIGRCGYHPGHVVTAASDSVVRFSRWVAAAGETFDHDRDVTGPSLLRPPLGAPATTAVLTTNTIATKCPLRSTLGPPHQKTGRGTSARPRTRLSSVTRR